MAIVVVIIKLITIWCVFLLLSEYHPQRYQLALILVMPDVFAGILGSRIPSWTPGSRCLRFSIELRDF